MNMLLAPVGSYGDVHPFIGLGRALRARGHDVTLLVNGHFAPLVERAGLACAQVGTAESYHALTGNRDLWHPRRGLRLIGAAVNAHVAEQYAAVCRAYQRGRTVVAAPGLAFGARIAQERLGVPLATIHLQPACIWSEHLSPRLAGLPWADRLPRRLKRALFRLIDLVVDRTLGPSLNDRRRAWGLPPVRRIFGHWWHSPQRVLGLFPEWFGPPQPDWPAQTRATGFPLYDEADATPMPGHLVRFLDAGTPPIVFTPGSANRFAARFLRAAVGACARLGRRGVLLTRYDLQVPDGLPPTICHAHYAPLSRLLPRSVALVHHGGVGTLAQGLAAGVPQLLMPMAYDQPDNAARLHRIGVGDAISPVRFRRGPVARALERLLGDPAVARRCRATAGRMAAGQPIVQTCQWLEELGGSDGEG